MVPCPEKAPPPNRQISKEARAKLFSVYLRPWTLAPPMATADVPFLGDLAAAPAGADELLAKVSEKESFRLNWKEYVG